MTRSFAHANNAPWLLPFSRTPSPATRSTAPANGAAMPSGSRNSWARAKVLAWRSGTASLWSKRPRTAVSRSPTCRPNWRTTCPGALSACCSWAYGMRPQSSPSTWKGPPILHRGPCRGWASSRTCDRWPCSFQPPRRRSVARQSRCSSGAAAMAIARPAANPAKRSTAAGSASARRAWSSTSRALIRW